MAKITRFFVILSFLILETLRFGCELALTQLQVSAKVGKSRKIQRQRYKRRPFPTPEDKSNNQKNKNHLDHTQKHLKDIYQDFLHQYFFYLFFRPDQTRPDQTQTFYPFHRPFHLTPTWTTLRQTSRHFSSFCFSHTPFFYRHEDSTWQLQQDEFITTDMRRNILVSTSTSKKPATSSTASSSSSSTSTSPISIILQDQIRIDQQLHNNQQQQCNDP